MGQTTTAHYAYDMPPTKKFASMNLEPAAIEEVRRLARWLSLEADRNVPLSEAVTAAIMEARAHPETLIARVTRGPEDSPDE